VKTSNAGRITIIVALRNSESTIKAALESLEKQKNRDLIDQIITIDNQSTDNSAKIISQYKRKTKYKVRQVLNKTDLGLAGSFNYGISLCKSEFFILMHSDVVVSDDDAFRKAIAPFSNDARVVAAHPITIQPYEVWKNFSFWQKCFFRTYAGVDAEGLLGKFDCFKRELFVRTVKKFDNKTHRTAGEDNDMSIRIKEAGLLEARSGVRVVHLHSQDNSFTLRKLVQKESQHAEAAGAIFRRHGIAWLSDKTYIFKVVGRPLLIIGLFVPYIQYLALVLLLAYSILVTKRMFFSERNDLRIFILPLVNIAILFYYSYYLIRGFVTGKQQL
jgi:glycosyltransferase involved in cell wall biosynthesis